MWLLNASTLALHFFQGRNTPPYAILSHMWKGEEVSFQDVQQGLLSEGLLTETRGGDNSFPPAARAIKTESIVKIKRFCDLARELRLTYVWVDTCCIDKSSSAELSEAINSMFKWYKQASICLVYLYDVNFASGDTAEQFKKSRWFRRGWTLQELIAPHKARFFDCEWTFIGTRALLRNEIFSAAGISEEAMKSMNKFSVGQRMSWASKRETTREEDVAYCLLGIFDVNMPLLYGEGQVKAFYRLQIEVMSQTTDETIFAWTNTQMKSEHHREETGLLAQSPGDFAESHDIVPSNLFFRKPYIMTNRGIQIEMRMLQYFRHSNMLRSSNVARLVSDEKSSLLFAAPLNCGRSSSTSHNIFIFFLRTSGSANDDNQYCRIGTFAEVPSKLLPRNQPKEIYVATPSYNASKVHHNLNWE